MDSMERRRILVVEDDSITRSFLADILRKEGYEVRLAENGKEALDRIQSEVPDLILSDILMPEMSGLDLFRKVQEKEELQNLPFIFLTALDDGEIACDLKALGPDDYIMKPVRPRFLLATLKGKLLRKESRDREVERERDRLHEQIRWSLSHELRTPLTIIQGISEILLSEGTVPEEMDYQELLQNLRAQSLQLGALIEHFLLVSRIDAGVEEEKCRLDGGPCPIADAVEEAAFPFWERAREKGVLFRVEIEPGLAPARVHRPHLMEILKQVLDNGFKFADPKIPQVTLRAVNLAGGVKVSVTDNGQGISASDRSRIFQKLTQVDRKVQEQQGSGLGLYIVKRLTDMNRGSASLNSEPGQGTEVEIVFPGSPENPLAEEPRSP